MKWMLEQEAVEVIKKFDLIVNTEEAITFVMDYTEANQHIISCAYDAMGRDEMKRFFYADFIDVLRSAIEAGEKELSLSVDEDFKAFLADFYTEALAGMLIDWIKSPQKRNREKILQYILLICRTSIPNILITRANGAATPFTGIPFSSD